MVEVLGEITQGMLKEIVAQKRRSSDDCWQFGRDFKVILCNSLIYLGGFLSLLMLMHL